jgi:hypothetical protein
VQSPSDILTNVFAVGFAFANGAENASVLLLGNLLGALNGGDGGKASGIEQIDVCCGGIVARLLAHVPNLLLAFDQTFFRSKIVNAPFGGGIAGHGGGECCVKHFGGGGRVGLVAVFG